MTPAPSSAHLDVSQRIALGKEARSRRSRRNLGRYEAAPDRRDPVEILAGQEADRVAGLLPLRHERMSQSPFAFLRGGAAVMAGDQGAMPNTGLMVQACGDAHLANFGLFGAPDRGLVFDVNDFDETNPAPFEWDVQRLATSFVVAAQEGHHSSSDISELPRIVGRAYRDMMSALSTLSELDAWYYRIDTSLMAQWAKEADSRRAVRALRQTEKAAHARDRWSAVKKLTEAVDGSRRFRDQPPMLVSLGSSGSTPDIVREMYDGYLSTLLVDRAQLLSRYTPIDIGHKVVGVGSVGLLAFVALMQGRDEDDLLVLQFKQAVSSVLEPFTEPSQWPTHGRRVVAGQRLMQAATDAFLGWTTGPHGASYYVRQLRDMKWSPDIATMTTEGLAAYAGICGAALARAHARAGDSVAISAYLGSSERFDRSMQEFALAYAEQSLSDYQRYTEAITSGRVALPSEPNDAYSITLDPSADGSPILVVADHR